MLAVHAVEILGPRIIGLEVIVAERPGRRDPAVVPDLAEILLAQAEQRRAIKFRVAADVVMNAGMERASVFAVPRLLRYVF